MTTCSLRLGRCRFGGFVVACFGGFIVRVHLSQQFLFIRLDSTHTLHLLCNGCNPKSIELLLLLGNLALG
jgi:hypothetical protein